MLTDEKQKRQRGVPALMVPRFGGGQLLLGASEAEAPQDGGPPGLLGRPAPPCGVRYSVAAVSLLPSQGMPGAGRWLGGPGRGP